METRESPRGRLRQRYASSTRMGGFWLGDPCVERLEGNVDWYLVKMNSSAAIRRIYFCRLVTFKGVGKLQQTADRRAGRTQAPG